MSKPVKRPDIPDEHVLGLARQQQALPVLERRGVVRALMAEGIPERLALAKVEHMISRRLLECGVSPYYAWPLEGTS
jgi:hypothetical protein